MTIWWICNVRVSVLVGRSIKGTCTDKLTGGKIGLDYSDYQYLDATDTCAFRLDTNFRMR